jgi:hypothetical protein
LTGVEVSGGERMERKGVGGEYGRNTMYSCMKWKNEWREGIKENDGGVNLTKLCCKYFCKCHSVPQVQQQYNKKPVFNLLTFSSEIANTLRVNISNILGFHLCLIYLFKKYFYL